MTALSRKALGTLGLFVALLVTVHVLRAQEAAAEEQVIVAQPATGDAVLAPSGKSPAPSPSSPSLSTGPPRGPSRPDGPEKPGKPGAEGAKPGDKKEEPGEKKAKPGEEKAKPGEKRKADDTPKTIERPTEPPKPPDPEELKVRPDEQGKIRFSFNGQPWPGVLEWLADISGMSLDWQEVPGDYLNLTTQRSYTVQQTRDLINLHLLARGFTLLRHGEILSVVNTKKINLSMVPRVEPGELDSRQLYEFVKVSFPLDWLTAEAAAEELKPMLSPNGKLVPLSATNRLEAVDAVVNLREIHRLLTEEQSTEGQERLVREFKLLHARATDVRKQLQELLGIESKAGGPKGPMTPQQMQQAQQRAKMQAELAKQQGKKPGGPAKKKPEAKVYLVVNQRKNSIVAHAPPDKMAIIQQAIKLLDVPSDRTQALLANMDRMQVYRLDTIDPEPLVKTLEELGDLDPNTQLKVDQQNRAIVVYGPLADHVTIRALVDKLDGGGRKSVVIQLEALDAKSVARTIDFMMGGGRQEQPKESRDRDRGGFDPFGRSISISSRSESRDRGKSKDYVDTFRVDADAKNNTLLLWANQFEVAKVQDLLENLRQVSTQDGDLRTVKIHRLETIDPEPLVRTLEDIGSLDFRTTLEVDQENNTIIARATAADHETIRALIGELDGSGREFHVIPLRRLEADYVAGTIMLMKVGKEDKQESGSGWYGYWGRDRSRDEDEEKRGEFCVDADVEYNRLLLWANDIEVQEVTNLLMKLGEMPPEGGDPRTVRVLDVLPGPDRERLLEHIRRAWPSLAPNPLVMPPAEEPKEQKEEGADKKESEDKSESEDKAAAAESRSASAAGGVVPPSAPAADQPDSGDVDFADANPGRSVFRLAVLEQEDPQPDASPKVQQEPAPQADSDSESAQPSPQPEQAPSEAAPADSPGKLPPVSITQAPDGRLVITSEDTGALDRLQELMMQLAPPRKEYEVFHLRYAEAYWVKLDLEDFFKEEEKDDRSSRYDWYGWYRRSSDTKDTTRRLSKRRPLKFVSNDATNTILVQGADPSQLRTIDDLIKLYDQPPLTDSESTRTWEVFQIRYSKAAVVADAVKEVYRDLLSDRDKALINRNQQKQQRPESRYTYIIGGSEGSGDSTRKAPRFKGYLSIGVDELSNTLTVSAPEFLFRDVSKMIKQLDEAAKPVSTVRVVKVGPGIAPSRLRETLAVILGEAASATGRQPADKPPGHPPGAGGTPKGRSGPGGASE